MLKLLTMVAFAVLFLSGCALNGHDDQISIDVFNGVQLDFPIHSMDEVNGSDIEFYSEGRNIGLFKRVAVPKEEQPAIKSVKNGFELAKKGNQPPYELSLKAGFYGFAVDYNNMTTVHVAAESEPEYMVTMSVPTHQVETLINSLR